MPRPYFVDEPTAGRCQVVAIFIFMFGLTKLTNEGDAYAFAARMCYTLAAYLANRLFQEGTDREKDLCSVGVFAASLIGSYIDTQPFIGVSLLKSY